MGSDSKHSPTNDKSEDEDGTLWRNAGVSQTSGAKLKWDWNCAHKEDVQQNWNRHLWRKIIKFKNNLVLCWN